MKVLLAAPASGASGGINRWTKHILAYYNSLQNMAVSLEVFDLARSGFIPDDISLLPRLQLAWKDYITILKGFKAQLKGNKYDVVHITSSAGLGLIRDLLMIRLAHKKGIKAILHFRFGRIPQLFERKNWESRLLERVIRKADHVIVLDQRSFDTLSCCGFNNVSLLPNPIAPKVLEQIDTIGEVGHDAGVVLFIGHCIVTKGVFELVEACRTIPGIRVRMIGAIQDDVRQKLREAANHGEWLEIMGEQPYDKVIKEMKTCDVFVLPTYTEGFPNVILEAMACGCAIVTTPVGAIPEMLEEKMGKHYGLLTEPKDVKQLHDAIVRMLEEDSFKSDCRKNVLERVINRYSMPQVWRQLINIWEGLYI